MAFAIHNCRFERVSARRQMNGMTEDDVLSANGSGIPVGNFIWRIATELLDDVAVNGLDQSKKRDMDPIGQCI
jgi:hypothetical protein